MGWFENLREWVKKVWSSDAKDAIAHYSYSTMGYAFKQARVVPHVVTSVVTHVKTNTVFKHLVRIAVEDLLPLVLVRYANQLIQSHGNDYLNDEPERPWLSTKTVLQMSLVLLNTATYGYRIKKQTQLVVRTALVTLEAPVLLNSIPKSMQILVCVDEKCSVMRYALAT